MFGTVAKYLNIFKFFPSQIFLLFLLLLLCASLFLEEEINRFWKTNELFNFFFRSFHWLIRVKIKTFIPKLCILLFFLNFLSFCLLLTYLWLQLVLTFLLLLLLLRLFVFYFFTLNISFWILVLEIFYEGVTPICCLLTVRRN